MLLISTETAAIARSINRLFEVSAELAKSLAVLRDDVMWLCDQFGSGLLRPQAVVGYHFFTVLTISSQSMALNALCQSPESNSARCALAAVRLCVTVSGNLVTLSH